MRIILSLAPRVLVDGDFQAAVAAFNDDYAHALGCAFVLRYGGDDYFGLNERTISLAFLLIIFD